MTARTLFTCLLFIALALPTVAAQGGPPSTNTFCSSVGSLPGTHPLLPGSDHRCEDHAGDDHSFDQIAMIDLSWADLSGANLTDTVMPNATLDHAWLFGADLTHIDLSSASLRFASLNGANLTIARLANADFSYADLSGVTGLTTIAGVPTYNDHTDFSNTGFDPAAAGWNKLPVGSFETDRDMLSLAAGGIQRMFLDAGSARSGDLCLILGSASGTSPGITAYGFPIPLNYPDIYFDQTLNLPNTVPLIYSAFALDSAGRSKSVFLLPQGAPAGLAGIVLHHAFVAYQPTGITFVSSTTSLTLVP